MRSAVRIVSTFGTAPRPATRVRSSIVPDWDQRWTRRAIQRDRGVRDDAADPLGNSQLLERLTLMPHNLVREIPNACQMRRDELACAQSLVAGCSRVDVVAYAHERRLTDVAPPRCATRHTATNTFREPWRRM